jgi:diguanylate cyclase (GGDEF)-like protein
MNPVFERLSRVPRAALTLAALAIVAALGAASYFAPDWSLSILYLIPIAMVAGPLGLRPALGVSAASSAALAVSEFRGTLARVNPLIPWWNTIAHFTFFAVTSGLLVALRDELGREERLARVDPATGAPNRRAFLEAVSAEISRAERYGKSFAVGVLDLDNFKAINDSRGHEAGDEVLRILVQLLRKNVRTVDTVARLGGDEFGILLPETGQEGAGTVVGKLQDDFNEAMRRSGQALTFSGGVMVYREPPESVAAAMMAADELMYRIKKTRKGGILTATTPIEIPGQ